MRLIADMQNRQNRLHFALGFIKMVPLKEGVSNCVWYLKIRIGLSDLYLFKNFGNLSISFDLIKILQ
jgi:hypothetical protein